MASNLEESIQVVWHDPTSYQALRHGPPYLPVPGDVKLSSDQRSQVRRMAKKASALIAPEIPQFQDSPFPSILAALQAAALTHQVHHWMAKGPTFFADHGLFERLYNTLPELIDQVAEKAVGVGVVLTDGDQAHNIATYVGMFSRGGHDMVARSLKATYVCLEVVRQTLEALEAKDLLSHGVSNLLEGVADKLETSAYLLQQRSAAPQRDPYDYDRT